MYIKNGTSLSLGMRCFIKGVDCWYKLKSLLASAAKNNEHTGPSTHGAITILLMCVTIVTPVREWTARRAEKCAIAEIPHSRETCEGSHEAWLYAQSIQLLLTGSKSTRLSPLFGINSRLFKKESSVRSTIGVSPQASGLCDISRRSGPSDKTHAISSPPTPLLTPTLLPYL